MFLNGTRKRKVCRRNAEVDLQVLSKFQFTHVCNKPVQALTRPDAHHQPAGMGHSTRIIIRITMGMSRRRITGMSCSKGSDDGGVATLV